MLAALEGFHPALADLEHHATLYAAPLQPLEYLVDRIQRLRLDSSFDRALGGELQGLLQVFTRADDRATDGQALEHDVKDRRGELAGRQADEYACTASTQHADSLAES